jgi:diguanylate cyclase (GGDEF)-like protein/PAS domain S-box-containing protein
MISQQPLSGREAVGALPVPTAASPGLAVVGSDLTIRSANQVFLSGIGASAADAVGKPLTFFLGHRSDPLHVRAVHEALANGREYSGQVEGARLDGTLFVAELGVVPVVENGALQHFVAVLRELREVPETEAVRDATCGSLHRLLEHLPAGVVVHDSEQRIIAINARATELLGTRPELLVGRVPCSIYRFLHDDGTSMDEYDYPVARTLSERHSLSDVVVGVDRGDGAPPLWLICNTYLVCDNGRDPTETVVCFTDCTKLKRIEQSLHKSEERLRLVLQGSTDAPWDWNLQTGEIYHSPRWWEMIGRAPGELPDDAKLWQRMAHPDDAAYVQETLERVLNEGKCSFEFEFRLRHKDGHYVPVLLRAFVLRDQQGRPLRVSGTNTDLTERKEAEHHIHELAYFDSLTGLPNRRFLVDELHRVLGRNGRSGETGALLFLDLDNFKLLNDTLGHGVGDLLLHQVAERLRHAVRDSDFVARLGGDEFVILLESLGMEAQAAANEAGLVGHKLLAVCAQPYALPGRSYRSTISIGITMFATDSGGADVVLRQADMAMYQAKAGGRDTLRFFDPAMQAAIDRRYALEHDLREGLLRNEFRLYCQPQFDAGGKLAGGEILLRWQRAGGKLVGPAEFIGLAEATGLVLSIGQWVLRETCKRLAAWADNPRLSAVPLAVNVSAPQLRMADFAVQVLAIVRDTGANPERLGLELTESLLAENIEDVIAKMERLKRDGVRFSIDDFGTGYSSLSYLKRFPLETLKIDRSFVHDIHTNPDAAAIVEVIITLARKLGLKVTAEGVEQEAQREFLHAGGCDQFQGFLLGRPVALDEFERHFGTA